MTSQAKLGHALKDEHKAHFIQKSGTKFKKPSYVNYFFIWILKICQRIRKKMKQVQLTISLNKWLQEKEENWRVVQGLQQVYRTSIASSFLQANEELKLFAKQRQIKPQWKEGSQQKGVPGEW